MPAKSKSQQRAAGMALAVKRGEMSVDDLKGAAKEMYNSMNQKELRDFAKTSREGLPEKIKKEDIIGQIAALIEDPDGSKEEMAIVRVPGVAKLITEDPDILTEQSIAASKSPGQAQRIIKKIMGQLKGGPSV